MVSIQHHSQTSKAFCHLPDWKLRRLWSCLNASILSPISQVFTDLRHVFPRELSTFFTLGLEAQLVNANF